MDNRAELASQLGVPDAGSLWRGDSQLMRRAWDRWGDAAPSRIFGDWAFAAWDPSTGKLFVARDHSGHTAIYYHAGQRVFAFASSARALLALGFAPNRLNELFLARLLVSWIPRADGNTSYATLRRLPPAHSMGVYRDRLEVREYWRPEDTPELHLAQRSDYVEAFREVFDCAVRDRLPAEGKIASTLSGGLDSGSVTVTGARYLRERGRRLAAFTSVPLLNGWSDFEGWFGDELPLARASAEAAGNVDLNPIDSAGLSPLGAVRRMFEVALDPQHAAANLFWMLELNRIAAAGGCKVLLMGQLGNGGASWFGDPFSQALRFRIGHFGWQGWLRRSARHRIPRGPLLRLAEKRRRKAGVAASAIRPEFARRLRLVDRWVEESAVQPSGRCPSFRRCQVILPTIAKTSALFAEMGAAAGLDIRDPTGDARLLALCLSIPDRIFIEPGTGLDRWVIREAMKGRLPDEVRLNRRRGMQAADVTARLRAAPGEMEDALSAIERGPAADYVDAARLRQVWEQVRGVRTGDTRETRILTSTVLMRGVMAGLFVDGFAARFH